MAAILVGEEPYSIYPAVSESSNRPDFIGNFIIKAPQGEIVMKGVPPELKHLSRVRKINTIEIP